MPEQDEAMDRATEQAAMVRGEHAAAPESDEAMGQDEEPIGQQTARAAQNAASAVYAHGHFL